MHCGSVPPDKLIRERIVFKVKFLNLFQNREKKKAFKTSMKCSNFEGMFSECR